MASEHPTVEGSNARFDADNWKTRLVVCQPVGE